MEKKNEYAIHRVNLPGKEVIIVGTAHISRESIEQVRDVILEERPECVCVELDEKRYKALSQEKKWESKDLIELIKQKQLATLLANMILGAYQKRLGDKLGIRPGSELAEAVKVANDLSIPVELCDRDVRVTLRRAWRAVSVFKKGYLLASLLASLFDDTQISEERLRELKKSDVITELMEEIGKSMPELKRVLIDERDTYLSEKIKAAPGKRVVAVVGAGHVDGIIKALAQDRSNEMEEIGKVPPVSRAWKLAGWIIPGIIVTSLVAIGFQKGTGVAGENVLYWIMANGTCAALGALLALAHPLTIASAFAAAPVTSLTPVIGAGYVTAFVQALVQPPVVREFKTALHDMNTLTGWWRNNLLKVFLAFLLPGIGSMIGTWLGGYRIVSNLF